MNKTLDKKGLKVGQPEKSYLGHTLVESTMILLKVVPLISNS